MEIQPVHKRAAQVLGLLVVLLGGGVLVASCALFADVGFIWLRFALVLGGVAIIVGGRRIIIWGSGE